MAIKCDKCGKKIELFEVDLLIYPENMHEKPDHYCKKCYDIKIEKIKKEYETISFKIKCPYCKQWFPKPIFEKNRKSVEEYIVCPHCRMKIMQGNNEIIIFREEKMKDEKYPTVEDKRNRKRLRKLRKEEEKYEETQKEEKKKIQKDKIIDDEEDEEKEEEDEYANYSKKRNIKD